MCFFCEIEAGRCCNNQKIPKKCPVKPAGIAGGKTLEKQPILFRWRIKNLLQTANQIWNWNLHYSKISKIILHPVNTIPTNCC